MLFTLPRWDPGAPLFVTALMPAGDAWDARVGCADALGRVHTCTTYVPRRPRAAIGAAAVAQTLQTQPFLQPRTAVATSLNPTCSTLPAIPIGCMAIWLLSG